MNVIDWERQELRPHGKQNHTHVWVVCDNCSKGRWMIISEAHRFRLPSHLCHPCAMGVVGKAKRYLDPSALGKTCPRCKEYKARSKFGRSKYKRDGLKSICKECARKQTQMYRQANPRKALQSRRIAQAKRRAQKKHSWGNFNGADWELILKKYGYRCLACDTLEDMQPDHIIPLSRDGVHHKSNIQPLCGKCNRTKQALIIDYRPDAYWADWT